MVPPAASRPADGQKTGPTRGSTLLLLALLVVLAAGFAALGDWQLHRRVWKLDLIARVNARVHARPTPAPGPEAWGSLTRANAEYRHVRAEGVFLNDRETTVQALTELGAGYWVLTPLVTGQGFTVLVNRGFVPPERRLASSRPAGQIGGSATVAGLLRISEPGGGFLQRNDPVHDAWVSRDVGGIASARGLSRVAPYFIDAEAVGRPDAPVGGLTVIAFPNSHLIYALTWFTLALMCAAAAVWLVARRGQTRPSLAADEAG